MRSQRDSLSVSNMMNFLRPFFLLVRQRHVSQLNNFFFLATSTLFSHKNLFRTLHEIWLICSISCLPLLVVSLRSFSFLPSFDRVLVPKNSQPLGFEVPKFWHSISSDAELLDEDLEEEIEETTTHHDPYPLFEDETALANETTQLGNDVYLHCRVQNLGEKIVSEQGNSFSTSFHMNCFCFLTDIRPFKVSWVRRKGDQLHLITFGDSLYSSDSRYSLKFKSPNDWQLHIQYANERDEGQFECQINTSPTLVFIVYLIVVGK